MSALFYSLEGRTLRSAFFGFSLELPADWGVSTARVSGKKALLWLSPASGHSDQLQITIFSRDEPSIARYIVDDELARRTFPGRASYPFGEAMTAPVLRRRLWIRRNELVVQIDEKEGSARTAADIESMLQSLRFSTPTADVVPSPLKAFKYLHPGRRTTRVEAPAGLVTAELEARLTDARSQGHHYDAALLALTLHRAGDARDAFRDACRQLEAIASGSEHFDFGAYAYALEAALLSGDDERVDVLARRVPPRPSHTGLSPDRLTYARTLALLALGDDESCRHEVTASPAGPAARRWMDGVLELTGCVAERNRTRYPAALSTLLARHHRKARSKRSEIRNSARSFVCVPATALALLAMRRGLAAPDQLPERHATLVDLLVVCVRTTSDGVVLPGTTIDLHVDYLPLPLLTGPTRINE